MRYQAIARTNCGGGNCPTIYTDTQQEDTVLIQGYVVPATEAEALGIPAGEALVRIPRDLLIEAVDHG